MKNKIDFQWSITESDFHAMMQHELRSDLFGSVRFGDFAVEFRCSNNGLDEAEHVPVTDFYLFGYDRRLDNVGYVHEMRDGQEYMILDDDFMVPTRRSLSRFKRDFEKLVDDYISDMWGEYIEHAESRTLPYSAWWSNEPEKKDPVDDEDLVVATNIGNIVVRTKADSKEYPGVWIGISRNGKEFDVAMIEVDQVSNDPAIMNVHVYSANPSKDEPVFDYSAGPMSIDNYFEQRGSDRRMQ